MNEHEQRLLYVSCNALGGKINQHAVMELNYLWPLPQLHLFIGQIKYSWGEGETSIFSAVEQLANFYSICRKNLKATEEAAGREHRSSFFFYSKTWADAKEKIFFFFKMLGLNWRGISEIKRLADRWESLGDNSRPPMLIWGDSCESRRWLISQFNC